VLSSRSRFWLFGLLLVAVLVMIVLLLLPRSKTFPEKYEQISGGMSWAEVKAMLGEPADAPLGSSDFHQGAYWWDDTGPYENYVGFGGWGSGDGGEDKALVLKGDRPGSSKGKVVEETKYNIVRRKDKPAWQKFIDDCRSFVGF